MLAFLCLLVALVPLAFAAPLFQPYLEAKEILVAAGAATVAALFPISPRRFVLPVTSVWAALAGLAAAFAASSLLSSQPSASLASGERLVWYFVLFLAAAVTMRTADARSMLAAALVAVGTIEAVYVLVQFVFGDPLASFAALPGKWRTFGTLGNPNWTGQVLAVTALVALGRVAAARPTGKAGRDPVFPIVCLALMILALTATLARGAWLAFAVGATAFFLVRRSKTTAGPNRRLVLARAVVGCLVFGIIALALRNPDTARYLLDVKSLRGRLWMGAVSLKMIQSAPWFGLGPGTFGLHFPAWQARLFAQGGWTAAFLPNATFTSEAHNDYLQIWAELGLGGLAAFGALLWIVLRRWRVLAADPQALGCWAALISLFVNSFYDFPLLLPTSLMLFAVLLGTVDAAAPVKHIPLPLERTPVRIGAAVLAALVCWLGCSYAYHGTAAGLALKTAENALNREDWKGAAKALETATHHGPSRFETWSMLGYLDLGRGHYARAVTAFNAAQKLGLSPEIIEWKAQALARSGQRDAALETWRELAWLRPDLEEPRRQIAALSAAGPGINFRNGNTSNRSAGETGGRRLR